MQEHTVTVGTKTHTLEEPFFVLATQNPIEMEGTYPLPEAQVDRFFFKLLLDYPNHDELAQILDRTTQKDVPQVEEVMQGSKIIEWRGFVREVVAAPKVTDYAVRLTRATQPGNEIAAELVNKYVRFGASPRGAQALLLAGKVSALRDGRFNLSFNDIQAAAPMALRHRILLNFEAEADELSSDTIIKDLLERVEETAKVA
jgi:MoxR-like ATPase